MDKPRELTWTEHPLQDWNSAPKLRMRAYGLWEYHHQESSSWYEAGGESYTVGEFFEGGLFFFVLHSTSHFNNDGLSEQEREEYEGDGKVSLCPHFYTSWQAAKESAGHHFKARAWIDPSEIRRVSEEAGSDPLPDATDFERQALLEIGQLANQPNLFAEMPPLTAFFVIGQLQLALRHPQNDGPSSRVVEAWTHILSETIAPAGSRLAQILEMGWDPQHDVRRNRP